MEDIFIIEEVLIKHLRHEPLSKEEEAVYQRFLNMEGATELLEQLGNKEWLRNELIHMEEIDDSTVWQKIMTRVEEERQSGKVILLEASMPFQANSFSFKTWIAIAAVVIIVFTWASLLIHSSPALFTKGPIQAAMTIADSADRHKTILILSDGRSIVLDSSQKGLIADLGTAKVYRTGDGALVYEPTAGRTGDTSRNSLTTPKAAQIAIRLPDGSRVWLNNSSTITYSVSFAGSAQRRVDLWGEAYFEVRHNPAQPFKVFTHKEVSGENRVEVFGTAFNIKAFADDPVERVTVVDGRIKWILKGKTHIVNRNQQATADALGQVSIDSLSPAKNLDSLSTINDADSVWGGSFHFEQASLPEVMREISRWYDVHVEYEHPSLQEEASANLYGPFRISHKESLRNVLQALEKDGVSFRLSRDTVYVRKRK